MIWRKGPKCPCDLRKRVRVARMICTGDLTKTRTKMLKNSQKSPNPRTISQNSSGWPGHWQTPHVERWLACLQANEVHTGRQQLAYRAYMPVQNARVILEVVGLLNSGRQWFAQCRGQAALPACSHYGECCSVTLLPDRPHLLQGPVVHHFKRTDSFRVYGSNWTACCPCFCPVVASVNQRSTARTGSVTRGEVLLCCRPCH
jgi:hypothetical protein